MADQKFISPFNPPNISNSLNILHYHTCNVCITTVLLFEQWRYEPVFSHCRNTENIFTVWPELLPAWLRTLASISCSIAFQVFNRKFRATVQIGQDSFFNVGQFVCHRFGLRFRLTIRDRRKHPKSVRDFVFHILLRHTVNKRQNYYQYHRFELYTSWDSER